MNEQEYRALPAISQSDLLILLDSPLKYQHREQMRKETDEMRFGTAFHTALLEPERFKREYGVLPEFWGPTKDGKPSQQSAAAKQKRAEFLAANEGTIWLDQEDMDNIVGMLNSVANNPKVKKYGILSGGEREKIIEFEYRGRKCKGRMDIYHESHPLFGVVCTDLKTTKNGHPVFFAKDVHNSDYDGQFGFYDIPKPFNKAFSLTVEKEFPWVSEVYDMTHWIALGRRKVDKAFDILDACEATGDFYGYTEELSGLPIPAWLAGAGSNEETA
jgi:hypothetical protein